MISSYPPLCNAGYIYTNSWWWFARPFPLAAGWQLELGLKRQVEDTPGKKSTTGNLKTWQLDVLLCFTTK